MLDCRTVETILQRAVAGAPLPDGELDQALAHVETCLACGPRFELLRGEASGEGTDALPLMDEPLELTALFERALTAALSEPEVIVRARAAARLGRFERLGPAALAALGRAAAEDPDEAVRAGALAALDELDDAVTISRRLIEAWSESPLEAAPYLADCLARLEGVARLTGTPLPGEPRVTLLGEEGLSGRVAAEENELRLTLQGLPPAFENTKPVVALPDALAEDAPRVNWRGETPGLVRAEHPVERGQLQVDLGNLLEPPESTVSERLFGQLYLLNPAQQHPTRL